MSLEVNGTNTPTAWIGPKDGPVFVLVQDDGTLAVVDLEWMLETLEDAREEGRPEENIYIELHILLPGHSKLRQCVPYWSRSGDEGELTLGFMTAYGQESLYRCES